MLKKILPVFLFCSVLFLLSACLGGNSAAKKLKIGDQAPDFSGTDLAGHPVSLSGYQGQPVILRFWSTDCKFCRADTPIFNQYFEKYKEAGLRVVYVNRHSDETAVRRFVADLEIGFPVLIDKDGTISTRYNIKVEPQTIVISPDHKIIAAILGGVSEAELKSLLGGYFSEKAEKQS
ncbi:MAG: redoxin domain-containing protein [Desulfobulbaceae bacterium]|nr:redoxin domain-containing protein [Desulfobulbaceae bacterium]HIJ89922.1 redoxin domain-containing protein [Deltaproteobacteria bacterium]